MRVLAITQARVGSSRLPAKVLLKIGQRTLLDIHLQRLKKSQRIDQLVVATTHEKGSEEICQVAEKGGVEWFQGDLNDVLDRFYQASLIHNADYIVRVTSDCPLLDAELVDKVIDLAISGDYDYCSNGLIQNYPDGQDVEVFKMEALKMAWDNAKEKYEREHVTPYLWNNCDFNGGTLFRAANLPATSNYNAIRMTVDEPVDFDLVKHLIEELGVEKSWMDYTQYILNHPDEIKNKDIIRNEGYLKSIKDHNK